MNPWAAVGQAALDIGTTAFNARQARHNRAWQERMSNTAYQRAADDLDAAGLNRVLALGTPASTPTGAMSQSTGTTAIEAGLQAATVKQQIRQSKAEEQLIQQKEKESKTAENLNDALAVQSFYQQHLIDSQRWQAKQTEKYLYEQTRRESAEADKAEFTKYLYSRGNQVIDELERRFHLKPSQNLKKGK